MYIIVKVECKINEFAWSDEETTSREMKIDVNDRQVYSLNVGNTADAMLQDAAVELMSKKVEQELETDKVSPAP